MDRINMNDAQTQALVSLLHTLRSTNRKIVVRQERTDTDATGVVDVTIYSDFGDPTIYRLMRDGYTIEVG